MRYYATVVFEAPEDGGAEDYFEHFILPTQYECSLTPHIQFVLGTLKAQSGEGQDVRLETVETFTGEEQLPGKY